MDRDFECYKRFKDGDDTAFEELVLRHRKALTLFIKSYVKFEEVAEDIAIDSFMYILVNPRKYDGSSSFKTFLFMIGRSRALNFLKRQKIIEFVPMDEVLENEFASSLYSVEQNVMKKDRDERVVAAIRKLPKEMKEAIFLIYYDEFSYEEAAYVMKKSKKQVDNMLYQAKKKLKIMLNEEVDFIL